MRKNIVFGITAFGLLILGLSLYVPSPRPARAAGLDRSTVESAPAKQEATRQPGLFLHSPSATGDLVGTVNFSQDCQSGIGVGVTYDGAGHLWVSCYLSNPDLLRTSATTGIVDQTYNIKGGLGALAYDATRNAIWAGPGCSLDGNVWLIQLDAGKNVVSSASQFTPTAGAANCLDDGIAFDASDDSIYYSADTSTVIGQYMAVGGALIRSFGWTGAGCYNSGLAIGGNLLFQGSDGCSHVWVANKVTLSPAFDFDTMVPGDPNFRDEGLSCDTDTFAGIGKQVMWSKEAFSPNRASAFEIPPGTCGVGGATPTPTPATCGSAFVIGDLDAVVGRKVTFWGAQWHKKNHLSGGPAPASFKGFANCTTPNPPTCGGTWLSDPGNSSHPPDTVPADMTVIVSSLITKSGPIESGDIPKMVTIHTNPGYGPNPGHEGTGTVTAVVCQSARAHQPARPAPPPR